MNDSKTIYLIRHGETEYNKLGLVQGSGIDANLNDVGKTQAAAFYARYKDVPFEKVYTSKLIRTHQTVESFTKAGLPQVKLEGLNEICWGNKEGKIITNEDNLHYYRMLEAWRSGDLHWQPEGGESPLQVATRQKVAWEYIMSHSNEKSILVCMHGRAIRILLCQLLGVHLSKMDDFKHKNTCLYLLEYKKGTYSLLKNNDTAHLEGYPMPEASEVAPKGPENILDATNK